MKYRIRISLFWQPVIIDLCGIKLNIGGINSFAGIRGNMEGKHGFRMAQCNLSVSEVLSCGYAVVTYKAGTPIRVA